MARRRAAAAALLGVAVAVGAAGAAGAAPRVAEPLPAVNLQVAWRVQPWPGPAQPSHPTGSVVVGTGSAAPPQDGVVTRTRPAADTAPALQLRNGGQAHWRLLRDEPDGGTAWVWTTEGAGLAGGTVRQGRATGLQVQVRWPGGTAPASVTWQFEQASPDDGEAPRGAAAQQASGELLLPLDSWQPVGRWTRPDGQGEVLQLRVRRLP